MPDAQETLEKSHEQTCAARPEEAGNPGTEVESDALVQAAGMTEAQQAAVCRADEHPPVGFGHI